MGGIFAQLRNLVRDARGNVIPLAAGGMFVAAALVGGGIDIGRAYLVKNRLQAACDAAVLAGRRGVATAGFDGNAQAQANVYFAANFDAGSFGARNASFSASGADSGNTINGAASAVVDSTVMAIFGHRNSTVTASCTASMGVGNSDVTLVLDTTGSMGWTLSGSTQTRIQALRTAMKNFYATLATATSGSNARIRYGFVPYSSSVNVGQLLYNTNPAYLRDSWTIQSREAVWRQSTTQVFDSWGNPVTTTDSETSDITEDDEGTEHSGPYRGRNACSRALPPDTGWVNDGSPSVSGPVTTINGNGQQVTTTTVSQRQVSTTYYCAREDGARYVFALNQYRTINDYTYQTSDPVYRTTSTQAFDRWDYKPVTYDTSIYKSFAAASTLTGSNGTAQSSIWAGCIEERASNAAASFSFSAIGGVSPSAADLDIDSAPNGSDLTKWAPMWPELAYYRTNSSGSNMANAAPSSYGAKAGSYCPRPARLLATMTQTEFDAYADALNPEGSTYHDIGMAWGGRLSSPDGIFATNVNEAPPNGGNVSRHIVFMTDGEMSTSYSIQTSWGIEYHDRRVTDDGYTNNNPRHTSRFLALCEAVKAKGIRVWVIAFGSTLTADLQTCATSASSFTASNATQLNAAFQEIAKQVGELRVVQ